MVSSYVKGRAFEQKIARLLSRRFGVPFHRVPMSGAFATTNKSNRIEFIGDVFTDNKNWNKKFNVVIECKKIKDPIDLVQYAKFVNGDKVMLTEWILQCIREATGKKGNHRNFWLVFSWNRGADLIMQGTYTDQWIFTPPIEFKKFLANINP